MNVKNNPDYKQLIRLNVEIEGLLRILAERDSAEAREAFEEKFARFAELASAVVPSQAKPEPEAAKSKSEKAETPKVAPSKPVAPKPEATVPADPKVREVKLQEAEEPQVEPEIPASVQAIDRGEEIFEAEVEADVHPAATIKLDEMLSRNESADLRRAFTINDRFRFRRELFGGDNSRFTEAIDRLMEMQTYDQAEHYIYRELGLDPENPEVVEFMAIVARHFAIEQEQ